ncbi:hypothetical protein COCSUDRAFT_64515 [Coccomyxa subellipsoidea C-169]|uniref:Pentatricopeptide repeat-containing protein-mitochondrial domain-containing protein n=1 Tax=Coccomyxa subellipsoidea (strain C-169) TaxID=574566 RepID=I0Z770_COCSC|nr:hypothetical protein COCSUDRAFT_64515 [Coccomyxa subellipsoidea C-169]EIE26489.1 hypothetical protein COCSUDRAFT_64515 [Coccomyxa subellipsoidea C-169]|eukprot:XP_005651033.1 hypothetical protein COCSUDRAFT_64515 [Coccomyxa subellipsoidea C-169]
MSGIIDVLKDSRSPEGAAQQFWRVFELYLDSIRPHKNEKGRIRQDLLPPMGAWNGYFMALAADRQGYHKVYRAVQIAEQEFDFNLSHLAYSNVLRACSLHDSKESAEFALKIVKGFGESPQGAGKKALNFAALACRNAGMVDDALRLLKEIRERYPQALQADFHVRRTHESIFAVCGQPDRLDTAMEVAELMQQYSWVIPRTPAAAVLRVALAERRDPEWLLRMLGWLPLPAGAERRVEGPFLEEGLAMGLLAEAARRGHVGLALRAWDFLEYSLLPLDLPATPDRWQGRREGSEEVEASESAAAGGNAEETGGVPDAQALLPINKPSIAAFQSLIDTFANARDIRQAFRMVWQLQQVHPERPDAVAFETALATLVNAAAESPEAADAAYYELEDMHVKGEPVSGPMLDCVVAACSQMGDLGRAFETFEAYGALGMKPDAQAYNAVLMGCIHHGMTASVPKILEEMEASGVAFNALTWSLHVEYHVVQGGARAAAAVQQAALDAGFQIRPSSLEMLIARCERNGEIALLEHFASMQRTKGTKDTYMDLSKLLRWRWKGRGDMQMLTGSRKFAPRATYRPWIPPEFEAVQ